MDSPYKCTWRGRVVYDRKPHKFTWNDVYRIQAALPVPPEPARWIRMILEVLETVLEFVPMGKAAKWVAEIINGLLPKLIDLLQELILYEPDAKQWRRRLVAVLEGSAESIAEYDSGTWWGG